MECVTISKIKPPSAIVMEISEICNYTFMYEHNAVYEEFIKNNPIETCDVNVFNAIKSVHAKKIVFSLYYLYIKGGICMDIRVIPTQFIQNLYGSNISFFCVKSIMNQHSLFLGVFGCKQGEPLVLELMREIINNETSNPNINNIMSTFLNNNNNPNVLFLNEKQKVPGCVSTVDASDNILFNHYYNDEQFYKCSLPIKTRDKQTDKKQIKIGISLIIFDTVNRFFSNGINQNSLYLCELFLNIGFDTYFVVNDSELQKIHPDVLKKQLYDDRFQYIKYSEILQSELDVYITLSFSDTNTYIYHYLKYLNTKLVGYFCGNSYIIDTEKILYNQHKDKQGAYDYYINNQSRFDVIWSIPQMSETNLHYWQILYRCAVVTVPFVWSTSAIKLHMMVTNVGSEEELMYKCKNDKNNKKIAIFEPNISIMKWALPSILICEDCYRKTQNIKHVYITNLLSSNKLIDFNMSEFNKLLLNIDLVKHKKCSVESRYNTLEFMTKRADIAVSHQWGNPLNYLYFDLAWLGYPIIHNANLCKDVGYYYNDFNYVEGSQMLNYAIHNHDENLGKYVINNRTAIHRFLTTNFTLMKDYENLIYDLFV